MTTFPPLFIKKFFHIKGGNRILYQAMYSAEKKIILILQVHNLHQRKDKKTTSSSNQSTGYHRFSISSVLKVPILLEGEFLTIAFCATLFKLGIGTDWPVLQGNLVFSIVEGLFDFLPSDIAIFFELSTLIPSPRIPYALLLFSDITLNLSCSLFLSTSGNNRWSLFGVRILQLTLWSLNHIYVRTQKISSESSRKSFFFQTII